ncbi:uncharacterized protein LOC108031498 [Drosophila biarmipes]|uniref:uncharacterized protein LOC108031498 n=1 Tax=Drosophila biarmipes TaxID=125945 RepID=UPI0007E8AAC2|nr:uncharacterized protein LOC108031498 [Drosophila biarmipes]
MSENAIGAPLSRIPGTSQVKEKHSKDLKTLTYVQLLEIKDRQSHFLSNKKRLLQLPDKGRRLQESYDKLLEEIRRRDEVEEATRMLSGLNIVEKGKITLNNLEWNGRSADEGAHVDDILDSDDEVEMDPLKVIAQGTMHEKKVKVIPPPASLITAEDLAEIADFKKPADSPDSALAGQSDTSSLPAEIIEIDASQVAAKLSKELPPDQHALYLIDKTETSMNTPAREKFMPFRTTKSNVHDPDKERVRKKGKHWEITAATPPLIQHKEVQLVPLAESAALQMDYMQRVKEVRIQQAEQRLARQKESRLAAGLSLPEESILKTKAAFRNYRDPQASFLIEGRQKASEANEVHDPTIQDRGTATSGIHYTVFE